MRFVRLSLLAMSFLALGVLIAGATVIRLPCDDFTVGSDRLWVTRWHESVAGTVTFGADESLYLSCKATEVSAGYFSTYFFTPNHRERIRRWRGFSYVNGLTVGIDWQASRWALAVGVPTWFAFCAALVYPAFYFFVTRPRLRRRRLMRHLCAKCRYDLTGNESGTCPECGREIPAETRAFLHKQAEGAHGDSG